MSLIQFNRAVRIAPRKGKPQVFAAGSVVDVTDPEILNHAHFKLFQKAGALQPYTPKSAPKVLPPPSLGVATKDPSARDGRVKSDLAGVKDSHSTKAAAASVAPETEVGGDASDEADADPFAEVDAKEAAKKKKGKK